MIVLSLSFFVSLLTFFSGWLCSDYAGAESICDGFAAHGPSHTCEIYMRMPPPERFVADVELSWGGRHRIAGHLHIPRSFSSRCLWKFYTFLTSDAAVVVLRGVESVYGEIGADGHEDLADGLLKDVVLQVNLSLATITSIVLPQLEESRRGRGILSAVRCGWLIFAEVVGIELNDEYVYQTHRAGEVVALCYGLLLPRIVSKSS
jgi:hypothetical protein